MFTDFREREREREKHQYERETSISFHPYAPCPGIEPATLWCTGQCSHQLHHLARAAGLFLMAKRLETTKNTINRELVK